jgi:hypothetical protein
MRSAAKAKQAELTDETIKQADVSPKWGSSSQIEPELATLQDAFQITGVSVWTWRWMAYRGEVESVKLGKRLLIPMAEIRRKISEGTRPRRDGLAAGTPAAPKQRKEEVRA